MTFDDYDALCERVGTNPYQCDDWWPTPEELKENIGNEINQNIDFLTWIIETNNPDSPCNDNATADMTPFWKMQSPGSLFSFPVLFKN